MDEETRASVHMRSQSADSSAVLQPFSALDRDTLYAVAEVLIDLQRQRLILPPIPMPPAARRGP